MNNSGNYNMARAYDLCKRHEVLNPIAFLSPDRFGSRYTLTMFSFLVNTS